MRPTPSRLRPVSACLLLSLSGCAQQHHDAQPAQSTSAATQPASTPIAQATEPPPAQPQAAAPDPRNEAPYLTSPRQLTFPDKFVKAGEAYFDHQTPPEWVIFQGVPRAVPTDGQPAETLYSMYVAKLKRDEHGRVSGLEEPIRVSEPGSSNTCGWFHPWVPGMIIYGSTLTAPTETDAAGYSRDRQRYSWQFPVEMRVVTDVVRPIAKEALAPDRRERSAKSIKQFLNEQQPSATESVEADGAMSLLMASAKDGPSNRTELERPNGPGYAAECSVSPDGRHVLFGYLDPKTSDVDIWVFDVRYGAEPRFTPLVQAKGYDGGPFFSPDGKRICYRSDRQGNSELQLFVADLAFDAKDTTKITGITGERQLTTQPGVVNWAPYWTRDGQWLIYASSASGHQNYELYAVNVSDPARTVRITHAAGFDGLPALSDDGTQLMWTSQRGGTVPGEERPSSQLWIADVQGEPKP